MGLGLFTPSFWCFWNITNLAAKGRSDICGLEVAMSLARAEVKMANFFAGKVLCWGGRLMRRFVDKLDLVRWARFGVRSGIGLDLVC